MVKANDDQRQTAERLSNEQDDTPSTSAKESNEIDLQFKGDRRAFGQGGSAND
ncbi:hypothetical protein [Paenibacillus xerothermodurans]|uniref:hypothetical protein n=1 Tax=Paenibacillus xerothermodurans TaxID=1977292 RepID=UPI0014037176|nr:hypothetical protein [Paenibacillus xerothermodurans]